MLLEFVIVDALTPLFFLQHLACITKFLLREGADTGCISRVYWAGMNLEVTGTGGDGSGSDGDGHVSGSTFVPVQFSSKYDLQGK